MLLLRGVWGSESGGGINDGTTMGRFWFIYTACFVFLLMKCIIRFVLILSDKKMWLFEASFAVMSTHASVSRC